jgi:dolichol-phosphate mannosyltransferase
MLISVVVPCYNEEEVIVHTHAQLFQTLNKASDLFHCDYEIIYVNDGSKDKTLQLLQNIHMEAKSNHGKIVVLSLSRNFGHQIALSAGLKNAKGDAIVAIDADLQDPPEVILGMIEKWQQGADVVYGVREQRAGESWFKLLTAKLFYLLLRKLTRIDIPVDTGDFRLMSRRALDVFNNMPECHRFIRGMIPWIGFNQQPIYYSRSSRFAGTTKYPFNKMLILALDGIISFSNTPLKMSYLMGFLVAGFCILYAFYILLAAIFQGFPVTGWASMMVCILFIGAIQLIAIGVLGEYIGRIYNEIKKRPLYIIDENSSRNREI